MFAKKKWIRGKIIKNPFSNPSESIDFSLSPESSSNLNSQKTVPSDQRIRATSYLSYASTSMVSLTKSQFQASRDQQRKRPSLHSQNLPFGNTTSQVNQPGQEQGKSYALVSTNSKSSCKAIRIYAPFPKCKKGSCKVQSK